MADFYESTKNITDLKNLKALYLREDHWGGVVSLKNISQGNFALKNFRTNDEGRLSSSKETKYASLEKTTQADCEAISSVLEDSPPALGEETFDYFGKPGGRSYRLIFAEGISGCVYDRVNQTLRFSLCFGEEDIPALIPYSEITRTAIQRMESLASEEHFSGRWFVCEQERRGVIPLSMVTSDGVENFYFGA
jgi:hypothetical protein